MKIFPPLWSLLGNNYTCMLNMTYYLFQPFDGNSLINPFANKPYSFCLQSFENTVGKGEISRNKQFLLFPQCFLPIWRTVCHFHQIQNCRLQTLRARISVKFVVKERLNKNFLIWR